MTKQLRFPLSDLEFEETNDFHEGQPKSKSASFYFDAATLPDAPPYQRNALHNQVYILYIIFPTWEMLKEGIRVLSGDERKSLAPGAKMATISSMAIHKASGLGFIEFWKKKILGKE